MKPIPRLADDMRIYLATEKMENQEILETLLESREDAEAALMTARQKVSDIFISYIPRNGENFGTNMKLTELQNIPNALTL